MHFDFRRLDELPRLAWCAKLTKGSEQVRVLHGPWLETGADFFVDGAWDGPFEERGFDRAVTLTGSGGMISPHGVLFCAATHNLERLFAIRVGNELHVSNSLVFALVEAGEELDLDHPNYFFDLLGHYRTGLSVRGKTLPTASGNSVELFDCVNFLIGLDLTIALVHKSFGGAPTDYQGYVDFMQRTVGRVMTNASDHGRSRRFEALSSISRGYDSAAVSVLATRAGCEHAVTFLKSGDRTGPTTQYMPDDGTELARYLDLEVTAYERQDVRGIEEPGPAEFFTNPFFSTEVQTPIMGSQLEGRLWMSGRHGEQFWDLDPLASQPWFEDAISMSMAGANSTEVRLRLGYYHFPVPYTLGVYAPVLNRISRSPEMVPWRIGGSYDRPIPRRLLEEAGVPRPLFGQTKMGGSADIAEVVTLSPRWEADFLSFYHESVDPALRSRLVEAQIGQVPYYVKGNLGKAESWLRRRRGLRRIVPRLLGDRSHQRWRSRYLYTFHWGLDRLRARYSVGDR
jgi:hypothetical protein